MAVSCAAAWGGCGLRERLRSSKVSTSTSGAFLQQMQQRRGGKVTWASPSSVVRVMARKGDGKDAKPKASGKGKGGKGGGSGDGDGDGGGGGAKDSAPAPRRIVGNAGGMSMKQQLMAVRYYQQKAVSSAQKAKPAVRTAFKKEKPKEGTEASLAAKALRFKLKQSLAALSLYGEDGERVPPVLIVDGYNVVGQWPKLKKHFEAGDLDTARERLMGHLGEYLHYKGIRVVCVWDARGGPTAGVTEDMQRYGVEAVYEGTETADTYIEKQVNDLLFNVKPKPSVVVATNDVECKRVVFAQGAVTMSSQLLIQELKRVRTLGMEQLNKPSNAGSNAGGFVKDMIKDDATKEALMSVLRESNAERLGRVGEQASNAERT